VIVCYCVLEYNAWWTIFKGNLICMICFRQVLTKTCNRRSMRWILLYVSAPYNGLYVALKILLFVDVGVFPHWHQGCKGMVSLSLLRCLHLCHSLADDAPHNESSTFSDLKYFQLTQ
jgi:hypothetical protein